MAGFVVDVALHSVEKVAYEAVKDNPHFKHALPIVCPLLKVMMPALTDPSLSGLASELKFMDKLICKEYMFACKKEGNCPTTPIDVIATKLKEQPQIKAVLPALCGVAETALKGNAMAEVVEKALCGDFVHGSCKGDAALEKKIEEHCKTKDRDDCSDLCSWDSTLRVCRGSFSKRD